MNDKQFEKKITNFYQNLEMSKDQVASLKELISQSKKPNFFSSLLRFETWPQWRLAGFASLIFLVGLLPLISQLKWNQDVAQAVASEISLNHHKEFKIEFETNRFKDLSEKMKKLDFSPARPSKLDKSYQMLGARYCSIQGNIATQIRLQDRDGQYLTLYQSRSEGALKELKQQDYEIDGIVVSMWFENGLFHGLAKKTS